MAGNLRQFTTKQLQANRKVLAVFQSIMLVAGIAYVLLVGYWIFSGSWNSNRTMSVVPLLGLFVVWLPVKMQFAAISKELDSRSDTG
jgi:hypothetical protein